MASVVVILMIIVHAIYIPSKISEEAENDYVLTKTAVFVNGLMQPTTQDQLCYAHADYNIQKFKYYFLTGHTKKSKQHLEKAIYWLEVSSDKKSINDWKYLLDMFEKNQGGLMQMLSSQ